MCKIHLVGNPNVGKTTMFNSLTKSSEHVGNWHGVTVDAKSKCVQFGNIQYEIIDLPGLYSLSPFSMEEETASYYILSEECQQILYIVDANNFKRNMYLAIQLLLNDKQIKIVINNYDNFRRNGGYINTNYLSRLLGCEVEVVNALKLKPYEDLLKIKSEKSKFIKDVENSLKNKTNHEKISAIYSNIDILANKCVKKDKNKIYGKNKADKYLLKLFIFIPLFLTLMFGIIYLTFFLVGPTIGDVFLWLLEIIIKTPIMAIIKLGVKSKFVIALFEEGIFGACFSVLGFLPQICLMYMFLSLFENSGLISRMSFVLDDLFEKVGLNGKMVYTMLMGFGCSTTATLTAKSMSDKNSKIKASLITPFMSCSAKLPIYTTIGMAIIGVESVWLIFGLYLLGIVVAIASACIFEKTILPSGKNQFLMEFPPLRFPGLKNIWLSMKTGCKQFVVKVFGVICCASVIMWVLSNLNIKFEYVGDTSKSILYSFSSIISWLFKPLGLDNPNIVCALLIGLVAKELILSSFAISNKVSNITMLGASLAASSSAVNFNVATGVVFLIFTLLYFPCISNLGVLLKEVGVKYTLISAGLQLACAYLISVTIYAVLCQGVVAGVTIILTSIILFISVKFIYNKIKSKKILCNNCLNCDKCEK